MSKTERTIESKTGKVEIIRGRERTKGTMHIDAAGVTLSENGQVTQKLTFQEIKRIRLLPDSMIIYPALQKGKVWVVYDFEEGDHVKNGTEILEWSQLITQADVKTRTISWAIMFSYTVFILAVFGVFLKWYVFPLIAVLIGLQVWMSRTSYRL